MAKAEFKTVGRPAMASHGTIQESPAPHGFVFQGGGYRRPPEAVFLIPESRKGDNGRSAAMSIPHRFTRRGRPRCARKGG